MAAFGWMGTAGHLIWPSLIPEMEFTAIYHLLQVVLAHPPHRFSFFQKARPLTLFSCRIFGCQRTQSENISFSSLTFYWELFSNLPTKKFKVFKIFFFLLWIVFLETPHSDASLRSVLHSSARYKI